jgi:hypothetical protein
MLGEERDGDKVAKAEHLSPLERSVMDLSEALAKVQAEQVCTRFYRPIAHSLQYFPSIHL